MRATTTAICPMADTVPTRCTVVRGYVSDTCVPNYSVAELIQAQLNSGRVLYIPRKVR